MVFGLFENGDKRQIVGKKRRKGSLEQAGIQTSKVAQAKKKMVMGARADEMKVFKKMKTQFRNRNKCYRELGQNGLDEGSPAMYFNFYETYSLRDGAVQKYLELFAGAIRTAGSSVEKVKANLEELVLDEKRECTELKELLGQNYVREFSEPQYHLVSKFGAKQNYLNMVLNTWKVDIPHNQKKKMRGQWQYVSVDRFGFSENIAKRIEEPLEKMKYFDRIVELNVRRKNSLSKSVRISEKDWNELVERRYEFLARLVREEANGQYEELTEMFQEDKDDYSLRIKVLSLERKKLSYDEMNFFSKLSSAAKESSPIEKIIDSNATASLTIEAEDFGNGMTLEDGERYLKKIFGTSKAEDIEKTGRFGVGFISVFAFEPDKVMVESTKGGESWEQVFYHSEEQKKKWLATEKQKDPSLEIEESDLKNLLPGATFRPEHPRKKGTRVTIVLNNRSVDEVKTIIKEAKEHITIDLQHREEPIYVQGEKVNGEFDIPAGVKVRFGTKKIEGIVGLVELGSSSYTLENNRILLEDNPGLIDSSFSNDKWGYQILVSSKYLNYDISRENVKRDVNYDNIVRIVRAQESKLAEEVFSVLEDSLHGKKTDSENLHLCWSYATDYINSNTTGGSRKKMLKHLSAKLPKAIQEAEILETIDGEYWTLSDLIKHLQGSKKKQILMTSEKSALSDTLQQQGEVIFKSRDLSHRRKEWLKTFGKCTELKKAYDSSKVSEELTEEEREFLDKFSEKLLKSPLRKQYGTVVASHFSKHSSQNLTQTPFKRVYMGAGRSIYFENNPHYKNVQKDNVEKMVEANKSFSEKVRELLSDIWQGGDASQHAIAVNFENTYIKRLMRHERIFADGLAHNLLLQSIAQSEYGDAYGVTEHLFKEERRGLGTYKHNRKELIKGLEEEWQASHREENKNDN